MKFRNYVADAPKAVTSVRMFRLSLIGEPSHRRHKFQHVDRRYHELAKVFGIFDIFWREGEDHFDRGPLQKRHLG